MTAEGSCYRLRKRRAAQLPDLQIATIASKAAVFGFFSSMKTQLPFPALLVTFAVLLSGCAGNQATIMQQSDFHGVSKPGQVYVGQFAFTEHDLNADQTILNRMNNKPVPSVPQTPEEQAGLAVAQTMQQALIKDLNKEGIGAIGTLNNVVPVYGSMLIEGELVTAKEGRGYQYQRLSPGFASGKAKVISHVNVYLVTAKGVAKFAEFYSDTQSSVAPLVATTTSLGTAAGATVWPATGTVSALTSQTQSAQADAVLIAKQIASKMQTLFIDESWASPTSPN